MKGGVTISVASLWLFFEKMKKEYTFSVFSVLLYMKRSFQNARKEARYGAFEKNNGKKADQR